MQALFETGRIIDLVLVVVAVETVAAASYLRLSGRRATGLLANVAAGACLLLGIRAALVGSDWRWVALWIGLSLPFHLADLAFRLRLRTLPSGLSGKGRSSTTLHTKKAQQE